MGNTTFSGPVRSESGFKLVSKNATTGTITDIATFGSAPVALADGDVTITGETHGGRTIIVPNGGQDNTYALPTPTAGLQLTFIYGGAAADGTDAIINTGSDTNYFIGSVVHMDTDAGSAGDEIVTVFSDGNSNSILQVNVPESMRIDLIADGTNWYVSGYVAAAAAPTFADQ